MRGVCLTATQPAGAPSVRRLKTLGVTGGRMVATDDAGFYGYDAALAKAGLERAHVYTGTTFEGAPDIASRARTIAMKVKPGPVAIIGNEWNVDGDASWPRTDASFVALWKTIAHAIKFGDPTAQLYVGGLMSEPDMLGHMARVWAQLDPIPDGIDWHPYTNTVEEIATLMEAARDVFGCEQSIFEWNWSSPKEIAGFERFLEGVTEHSCWFCWSDEQVTPYGLVTASGRPKAVYGAYRKALGGAK